MGILLTMVDLYLSAVRTSRKVREPSGAGCFRAKTRSSVRVEVGKVRFGLGPSLQKAQRPLLIYKVGVEGG